MRYCAQVFGLQRKTLSKILSKNFQLFRHKTQLRQELLPQNHLRHRTYASRMLQLAQYNADFREKNHDE